jgi:hypothetical protein
MGLGGGRAQVAGSQSGVFGSERLTGALLDRLTHHVHILEMNGDSYRLKQSKRRQRQPKDGEPADNQPQDCGFRRKSPAIPG